MLTSFESVAKMFKIDLKADCFLSPRTGDKKMLSVIYIVVVSLLAAKLLGRASFPSSASQNTLSQRRTSSRG